jgi:hypothetical protein
LKLRRSGRRIPLEARNVALAALSKKPTTQKSKCPTCSNCAKDCHKAENCWAKGGGNEGGGKCAREKKKGEDKALAAKAKDNQSDADSKGEKRTESALISMESHSRNLNTPSQPIHSPMREEGTFSAHI